MRGSSCLSVVAAFVAAQQAPIFRTEARLVEIYTTVVDGRGRYLDGLTQGQFRVLEDGQPQQIVTFEPYSSQVTCALLLDCSGTMYRALPFLKTTVNRFIDELRPDDSVVVYSFRGSLTLLQPLTRDKDAAQSVVLRIQARGQTALFDAIIGVLRDMAQQSGKKAIVLFTDGKDNASALTMNAAMGAARKAGTPIYAVAQGEALRTPVLRSELEAISRSTGGLFYAAKDPDEMVAAFRGIAGDLKHNYLLGYRPPPGGQARWRSIQVLLPPTVEGYRIRARRGYWWE